MSTANVVALIDTSNSMTFNGYVDITKRDAGAFISYAQPNDGIGVVTFDPDGSIVDPTSGTNLVIVDANLDALTNATNIINGLSFTGSATNMGGGIVSGKSLLDSATAPKAMVLLSDGYHNYGTNPLTVLPSYPIYTCAMGSKADTSLLKKIADQTGGKAYVAPYPSTMMLIFNDIRALPANVQSVQNTQSSIASQGYKMVPATLSNNNILGQFGVVWDDNNAVWTGSPSPGTNEISVTLVQPVSGAVLKNPVIVEKGYVVFNQPSPDTGQWYVQIIAGNLSQTLQITSGVFEFPSDSANALALNLDSPAEVKAGDNLTVKANVTDAGEPVEGLQMTARIEQPSVSKEEVLAKHEQALSKVDISHDDLPDHLSDDDKRIAVLRAQMMPETDILGPLQRPGVLTPTNEKDHSHSLRLPDTTKPGVYNVQVKVKGHSAVSNTPFQRSSIVTVEVK